MNTKLVIFTQEFPYGDGETFLEAELIVLCAHFEQVHIVSFSRDPTKTRDLPENCSSERMTINQSGWRKAVALYGIFSSIAWQELRIIRKVYQAKVDLAKLKTLLISLATGREIALKVIELIKDGFHIENTVFYSYWADDAAIGLTLASKKNQDLKAITRVHGWDLYFERSACHYLPFRHLLAEQLSGIYSISDLGVRCMQDVWKIPPENLHVARLGVHAQQKLERNEVFTVFSCSSVIPLKRVDLIAQAVLAFGKEHPVQWVHIGDGSEMSQLRQLIQERNEQTQVIFVGQLKNEEVMEAYRTYKPWVFINVSETEGIPVSIMEALSFGIPVIATDVGGTAEIVDEKTATLLPKDVDHLAIVGALKGFQNNKVCKLYGQELIDHSKARIDANENYNRFAQDLKGL